MDVRKPRFAAAVPDHIAELEGAFFEAGQSGGGERRARRRPDAGVGRYRGLVSALTEAGAFADVDPLAEDEIGPERLGDVGQEGRADESRERVLAVDAAAVAFPGLERDVLLRDGDLVGEGRQGAVVAGRFIGGTVQ